MSNITYLTFDLGSGPLTIKNTNKLELGEWNTITVSRSGRSGKVKVNDGLEVTGSSSGASGSLEIGKETFIGGVSDTEETSNVIPNRGSFSNVYIKSVLSEK